MLFSHQNYERNPNRNHRPRPTTLRGPATGAPAPAPTAGAKRSQTGQPRPPRPPNRTGPRNRIPRTNPWCTPILNKPSYLPSSKRIQERTHRPPPATRPVERRSHRRPAQQQGANEAKPASHAPRPPTEHPGNARNHKRSQKVPCFQHQPRENEPNHPRPAPPKPLRAHPAEPARPCGSTRRRRHAARQRPAEPARHAAAPARPHPPPNQPGARPSGGAGLPRGQQSRNGDGSSAAN